MQAAVTPCNSKLVLMRGSLASRDLENAAIEARDFNVQKPRWWRFVAPSSRQAHLAEAIARPEHVERNLLARSAALHHAGTAGSENVERIRIGPPSRSLHRGERHGNETTNDEFARVLRKAQHWSSIRSSPGWSRDLGLGRIRPHRQDTRSSASRLGAS